MKKVGTSLTPEMIDYETGIIPAVRNVLFVAEHMGCSSTTRNALTQKFEILDFYRLTRKTLKFKESPEGCSAIPFLPPKQILRAFNNYRNDVEPTFQEQPALETLFAYVETFWIWGANAPRFMECI